MFSPKLEQAAQALTESGSMGALVEENKEKATEHVKVTALMVDLVKNCYSQLRVDNQLNGYKKSGAKGMNKQSQRHIKQEIEKFELVNAALPGICNMALNSLQSYDKAIALHGGEMVTNLQKMTQLQDENKSNAMYQVIRNVLAARLKDENKTLGAAITKFCTDIRSVHREMSNSKGIYHMPNGPAFEVDLITLEKFAVYLGDGLDSLPTISGFKEYTIKKQPNTRYVKVYKHHILNQ